MAVITHEEFVARLGKRVVCSRCDERCYEADLVSGPGEIPVCIDCAVEDERERLYDV